MTSSSSRLSAFWSPVFLLSFTTNNTVLIRSSSSVYYLFLTFLEVFTDYVWSKVLVGWVSGRCNSLLHLKSNKKNLIKYFIVTHHVHKCIDGEILRYKTLCHGSTSNEILIIYNIHKQQYTHFTQYTHLLNIQYTIDNCTQYRIHTFP